MSSMPDDVTHRVMYSYVTAILRKDKSAPIDAKNVRLYGVSEQITALVPTRNHLYYHR